MKNVPISAWHHSFAPNSYINLARKWIPRNCVQKWARATKTFRPKKIQCNVNVAMVGTVKIASHWWSVFGIWCETRRRRCQIVKLSNTSIWRQQTGGNHLMIIEAPVLRQNWICEITFNSQWGGGHYIAWWWGGILMARLFNDFIPPPLLPKLSRLN